LCVEIVSLAGSNVLQEYLPAVLSASKSRGFQEKPETHELSTFGLNIETGLIFARFKLLMSKRPPRYTRYIKRNKRQ